MLVEKQTQLFLLGHSLKVPNIGLGV